MRLEDLTPGALVLGLAPTGPAEVRQVEWIGTNAVTVTFRKPDGGLDEQILYRDHEPGLSIERAASAYSFDGDGALFRLAAEALRIRMAGLFDPMIAVSSSDMEPLPHQLKAVYGDLLPRTPLRFLLADDPGAGKTIMAGLYIKELLLRGDLERCLIVAPGGLVEQWQDELWEKFGLQFELLTNAMVEAQVDGNVFRTHPRLIARMDQLSRREDLLSLLESSDWDLVVVDEAHRMSARYYGGELNTTKRYQLGQLLGRVTRHLLLMTATPHSGKEDDFQLFLALLDGDRFEGRFREGVHTADTKGLMCRRVKEELLRFDGTPLFPERRAYTVDYELSPLERDLYETVTAYVRDEMNRAERLKAEGEGRRGNTVGFALTVLQRRLASSPEAIWRSLQRRHQRLESKLRAMRAESSDDSPVEQRLALLLGDLRAGDGVDVLDDDLDELNAEELENLEEKVVDAASAAKTASELETEIRILGQLEELAEKVRRAGTDTKWTELRDLMLGHDEIRDSAGGLRKIIVFTEHRDTLNYLTDQIGALIGKPEAVVAIHGGVRREERRAITERFTHDPEVAVLVATDAAGEGLNLQRSHLMVNYDLPWNPNRIEQRFGRIHRIGQDEVCHLWNLVAKDTREGDVFARLLDKIEQQRQAYSGKVFDVLGEAFEGRPLRKLLLEAIRDGDRPEVKARLHQVIDATVGDGVAQLIAERALHHDVLNAADVDEIRRRMEEARGRRLSPHFIHDFFVEAFGRLGGRMSIREPGRWEVDHVPQTLRDRDRVAGTGAPLLERYERICFDREHLRVDGAPAASLVAPGHPLLDAVVAVTEERHRSLLKHGAVLIDPIDEGHTPRLLVAVSEEIVNGHGLVVSKRFEYVEVDPSGSSRHAGYAPYLDYRPATETEQAAAAPFIAQPWLALGPEKLALQWAIEYGLAAHVSDVAQRVAEDVQRTREQVKRRLSAEINYWDGEHGRLLDEQAAGKKLRISPETAEQRARNLERRLEQRLAGLALDERLSAKPPVVAGAALILPAGLSTNAGGAAPMDGGDQALKEETDRRAIALVMSTENRLGRTPEEQPHNNPGFDIRSVGSDGLGVYLEVKGRRLGAKDFTVTRTEVLEGRNHGQHFRLCLVAVNPDGPEHDEVRYISDPFAGMDFGGFDATDIRGDWATEWARGKEPH